MTKPLIDQLRTEHPHGHPDFLQLCLDEVALHSNKNHDYAHGGPPLGNFERVAAILALYPNLKMSDPVAVMLTYALKQMDAVLWGLSNAITPKVEGLLPRLGDISVYSKIAMCALRDRARQRAKDTLLNLTESVAGSHQIHVAAHKRWAGLSSRRRKVR